MSRTLPRYLATAALGLTILSACGSPMTDHDMGTMSSPTAPNATPPGPAGSSVSATPAPGPHNEADVTFAAEMVPHHRQAIQLSDLLLAKSDIDPDVTALARQIKSAQSPEVDQLGGWLAGWGQTPGMGDMHHGGSANGMLSQSELDELEQAAGAPATKLFLAGMIEHHTGAITMAQTELAQGTNPDAKKLAQAIVSAQQAEIAEMKRLSGR